MTLDTILHGDALEQLRTLPDESVHCCVTSPPYFGLRDYGTATWDGGTPGCDHSPAKRGSRFATPASEKQRRSTGSGTISQRNCPCGAVRIDQQIGLEASVEEYVARLAEVFAEVRRVLRADGTLWCNLGDSYAGSWGNYAPGGIKHQQRQQTEEGQRWERKAYGDTTTKPATANVPGLKPKDLIGVPWRVAFALQAAGWWLRSDIIWAKPNPMPESVTDRPTRSHEYIFLLAKSERYYYDAAAVREPSKQPWKITVPDGPAVGQQSHDTVEFSKRTRADKQRGHSRRHAGLNGRWDAMSKEAQMATGANKRTVWRVATAPYSGAHFATFPPKLIEPCILSGCPPQGVVLDPFFGSGTVGEVAIKHSRHYLGIELSAAYIQLAEERLGKGIQRVLWSMGSEAVS